MDALRCGVCRREFHELDEFMKHKKMLPDLYTCHRCGVFFHYENELKAHNDSHDKTSSPGLSHNGDDNFVNSSDTDPEDDVGGLDDYANHSIVMSLEEFNRITGAQQDGALANVAVKQEPTEASGEPIACPVCSYSAADEPAIYEHLFTVHNMVVAASDDDVLQSSETQDSDLGVDNGERKFVVFEPAATVGTSVRGLPRNFPIETEIGNSVSAPTPKRSRGRGRPKKLLRLT